MTVAQIQILNPSSGNVNITSLTLSWAGSPAGQVASVSLVKNGGGVIATGVITGTQAVFNFSDPISGGNGTATYQAVVAFAPLATTGNYPFSFTNGSGSNGQSIFFSTFPVAGATVTILAATPTPTSTPLPTSTPTASFTPTSVMVPVIRAPYPDPVTGPYPVTVNVQVPGNSTVSMDVFTLAFRKIANQTKDISNTGSVTWNLQDSWGTPVADGLYYLRIQVTGPQPLTKIFKVLITR